MFIQQRKNSKLAFAPDQIANVINKFTKHKSEVYCGDIIPEADIIHFHNCYGNTNGKPHLIQFHSEPKKTKRYRHLKIRQLVISQYHATLSAYNGCTIVRNPIDFIKNPGYDLIEYRKNIRIGYSPSTKLKHSEWADKGYDKTKFILEKLQKELGIEIDIITDVKLGTCIQRKAQCNIIIDECVTTSFHRSGLEGLALGKMTICSLGPEVGTLLKRRSGAKTIPFENIWIQNLESYLRRIIKTMSIDEIIERGQKNRKWMQYHWHPEIIAYEYIQIYDEELRKFKRRK